MDQPNHIPPPQKTVDISIIVPVYNVGPYIDECLSSLANQDFKKNYEVILINDASTDNSAQVCHDFAKKFPHIFIFIDNQKNQGVSVSRNIGLEKARGQYFMFVDPDDVLPTKAVSILFTSAEHYKADIIKGNNTIFNESKEKPARYCVKHDVIIPQQEILSTFFNHEKVRGHPWGKLYRRSKLGHIRFTAGVKMAQDLLYCSEVFSQAGSFVLIHQFVYRYRDRDTGSTGKKYDTQAYLHWLDSVEKAGKFSTTLEHRKAHKRLQVRTLTQLARECTHLPSSTSLNVINELEDRKNKWRIDLKHLLLIDRLGYRSMAQYLKMLAAVKKIEKDKH